MARIKLRLDGLHCANCAAKIERKLPSLSFVEEATLNFSTAQVILKTSCDITQDHIEQIQKMVDGIESGITVQRADTPAATATGEHNHHPHGSCCSHNHCAQQQPAQGEGKLQHLGHHQEGTAAEHKHPHEHAENHKVTFACLTGAVVLLAVSFFIPNGTAQFAVQTAAILIAGYPILIDGCKNLIHLQFEENLLVSIAVVASFILGDLFEAALVVILFRLGGLLEDYAVGKSRRGIEALTKIRAETANLVGADGKLTVVDARSIHPGDIIAVKPGERVPVDCEVETGDSTVDTSALTGESLPVNVERGSELLSGSINGGGLLTCRTLRPFEDSAASRIIELVQDSAAQKGKTEKFISRFARVYTPIVILLAIALAIIPPLFGFGDFPTFISRALVFLVASCPCALVISVPLGFFSAIGAISKKGVLVKGSRYLETLAKANCYVFDKTGTLTTGKLSVSMVKTLGTLPEQEVLSLAAAVESRSDHPIARCIATSISPADLQISSFEEYPGQGVIAQTDRGQIACGSVRLLKTLGMEISEIDSSSALFLVIDKQIEGLIEVADTVRPDTASTLKALRERGCTTVMLTGDHADHAQRVAQEVGIDRYYASLMPGDKVDRLNELKKEYTTVFVGDGINDAPVLVSADCGVAMGLGSDAAIENADVILVTDHLSGLKAAIDISRKAIQVVKLNIWFAIIIKAIVLILGAFGLAQMWMAVFADVGVTILAVLHSASILRLSKKLNQ